MKLASRVILFLLIGIATVFTMTAPAAANFPNHELARVIFWHLPAALCCSLFVIAAPYFAWRYFKTKELHWETRCVAAMEITLLSGLLTLATGIIFSKVQWGAYWNWDPRQTSFLLAMLMIGAYFALRSALVDRERRAANSSAYVLACILPILFLIFVMPRVLFSLHPSTTIIKNEFDPTYKAIFYSMFFLNLAIYIWMYRMRVRAGLLEEALEDSFGKLADSNDPTPSGVVRPISLHDAGG